MRRDLEAHPDYPSLLSLLETARLYGVRLEGVEGSLEDVQESDLPGVAVLQDSECVVMLSVGISGVRLVHPDKGELLMAGADFAVQWPGRLLRIEDADLEQVPGRAQAESLGRRSLIRCDSSRQLFASVGIGVMLALGTGGLAVVDLGLSLVALPLVAGLVVSILLATERHLHGPLARACHLRKSFDCHQVVSSPASRLLGCKVADLGVVYFWWGLFVAIAVALFDRDSGAVTLLCILLLCGLPYGCYSIYYQWIRVKKWCPLCVAAVACPWLAFAAAGAAGLLARSAWGTGSASLMALLGSVAALNAPLWLYLMPRIRTAHRAAALENELRRVRREPGRVKALVEESPAVPAPPCLASPQERDPSVPHVVVIVTLGCIACKAAIKDLQRLMCSVPDTFSAQVLLLDKSQESSTQRAFAETMVALMGRLDLSSSLLRVLDRLLAWYEAPEWSRRKLYDEIKKGAALAEEEVSLARASLEESGRWAAQIGLVGTPAVVVNSLLLPSTLGIADIDLFLIRTSLERAGSEA
jgi:uncharacterized membrane protein